MDSIGLGKYADGLINDYDDLEDLQLNVDLGKLEKVCSNMRGKVKMKHGDLDKFIRKLRECRDRFDRESAIIAPMTAWAPDAISSATASSSASASSSAPGSSPLSPPVVTSIYPVDYSQVSA